jgi:cbb3-type cytochrome oxidase subunit 1
MDNWALKFVRWGMGLAVLGLVTGYVPLGHYLMMGAIPSCPAAPVHGHTILLSFVGMTMFGLAYRALPAWMPNGKPPLRLVGFHFWLTTIGVLGVCINGTIGYEVLGILVHPEFYYLGSQGQSVRNLWFAIDGVFLTSYAAGCVVFLYIVMTKTAYSSAATTSEAQANQALHPTAAGAMLGGRGGTPGR